MDSRIPPRFEGQLRGIRLIVVTLAMGAVLFPLVVVFVIGAGESTERLISYAAMAAAAGGLAMGLIVPGRIAEVGRRQIARGDFSPAGSRSDVVEVKETGEAGQLLNLYRGVTIVGAAVLEGPALFAAAAYMLEGLVWVLIPAFVFPVLILVLHYPTQDRVEVWLAEQLRLLSDERRS